MAVLAPAPIDQEPRREARHRVLRRAVLVKDGGGGSSSCLILDVSAGGARVQLLDGARLPDGSVTLVDARSGSLHEATVVWRSGPYAGVSFSSSCTLEAYGAPSGAVGAALRVLAVDDDATNRFVLEKALNNLQAVLTFAVDGAEAVSAFETGRFDIVLMDLRMPRMGGFEAIRRIRALEAGRPGPRTPIMVVSAHNEAAEIAEALAIGADAHVAKPVNVDALLAGVRRLTTEAALAA